MESYGINSYTKRSVKVDARYYHPRKTTVLTEYIELVQGKMEVVENIEIVEQRALKPHVPDSFDRLQYLKRLAGEKKLNFSRLEVQNILER